MAEPARTGLAASHNHPEPRSVCERSRSSRPSPTLSLIVSLEMILLSTFVLIGRNRQAAFQKAQADLVEWNWS